MVNSDCISAEAGNSQISVRYECPERVNAQVRARSRHWYLDGGEMKSMGTRVLPHGFLHIFVGCVAAHFDGPALLGSAIHVHAFHSSRLLEKRTLDDALSFLSRDKSRLLFYPAFQITPRFEVVRQIAFWEA